MTIPPCDGLTELFFPDAEIMEQVELKACYASAVTICSTCPMTFECLERWKAEGRPDSGVWFGTRPHERAAMRRECRRCGVPLTDADMAARLLLHPECFQANRAERYGANRSQPQPSRSYQ